MHSEFHGAAFRLPFCSELHFLYNSQVFEYTCLYEVYLLSEACNAFTNYIVKILHRRVLGFIYIAFKIISCHKMKLEFNYKRKGITLKFGEYLQLFLLFF